MNKKQHAGNLLYLLLFMYLVVVVGTCLRNYYRGVQRSSEHLREAYLFCKYVYQVHLLETALASSKYEIRSREQ